MNNIDEQFIKEKVNPVVGFIYHTARQLGEDHAPNSMDMQYLKQGTEKVCELLREASPTAPPAESEGKAFDGLMKARYIFSSQLRLVLDEIQNGDIDPDVVQTAEEEWKRAAHIVANTNIGSLRNAICKR